MDLEQGFRCGVLPRLGLQERETVRRDEPFQVVYFGVWELG